MKKLFLLVITAILSFNLYCQVHWTKYENNPVLVPGSPGEWDEDRVRFPNVICYESTYHMWFTGRKTDTARIGHATSPDGSTWAKDTNNPVLDVGPEGAWDDNDVSAGNVLLIDSIFHMWYSGHTVQASNDMYQIGHATSQDGINWTKDPNNPVLTTGPVGDWDQVWVYGASVVYTNGTFQMLYTGYTGGGGIEIGYATSPDGVTWTKDPQNPVMEAEDWESPHCYSGPVIFDGSTYQMWYEGGEGSSERIGYATSEDGKQWVKYGQPVLRQGPPGSWDAKATSSASVLFDSTEYKYKMWYTGVSPTGTNSIGYAESDTCSDIIIPVLSAADYYYQNDSVYATSSENGIIYLTTYTNHYTTDAIREACIDSVAAVANTPVKILEQPNGNYMLYARDNSNNFTNPHKITIAVGTSESRVKSSISIYPNPAVSMVNIQTNKPGEFAVVIETLNGKEISSDRFNGNSHQLDLSSFQKGIYLITIRSKDFVTTRKIIKL